MLRLMRSGLLSKFFMAVLVLGGLGLALSDMGGSFRSGISSTDVAKIGGEKISSQEFHRAVQRALGRIGISAEEAYEKGLIDNILNSEIRTRVFYQAAKDYGIEINDEIIVNKLSEMLKPMVTKEKTASQALEEILYSQGITKEEFIKIIKMELANNILTQSIISNANYTPDIIAKDIYQYKNETRDFDAIIIENSSVEIKEKATENELKNFYEARKEQYSIPEKRDISVLYFLPEDIEKNIEISEKEVKNIYEENKDLYVIPEKRNIEQSVFETETTANKFIELLKKGGDFKELSKKASGSDDAFISKDDYSKDDLPEDYAEEIFKASKQDIIGPIETVMGWHVIRLNSINKERNLSFKEVKNDIKEDLIREKLAEKLTDTADELDDMIASGYQLSEIAKDNNLPLHLIEIKSIDKTGNSEEKEDKLDIFSADKSFIIETAFEYFEGELSNTIELASGGFAVVQVDNIYPKSYKKFEKVKKDIENQWTAEQKKITNLINSQKYLAEIEAGKLSLKSLAKDKGVKLLSYKKVSRSGDNINNDKITPIALIQIFNADIGKTTSVNMGDKIMLATVKANKLPDITNIKEDEYKDIIPTIQQAMQEEIYLQFYNYLSNEAGTQINRRLLDAMYAKQIE